LMAKDKAIAVLDEVLPTASLITPTAISEPMLGNIRLIADKCREHDTYMNFNSNATVLNGQRRGGDVLTANPHFDKSLLQTGRKTRTGS